MSPIAHCSNWALQHKGEFFTRWPQAWIRTYYVACNSQRNCASCTERLFWDFSNQHSLQTSVPPLLLPHRTKFFQSPSSLWVIPRVSTILHNVYNKDLNMAWFTRFWRETYVEVTNCRRWWKSYSSTSTLRRRTTSRIAAIQYNSASFQKDAMTRNSSCTELQLVKCKLCEEEKLFSNDNGSVHMKKEHLRPAAKTQECLYGCVLLSFQSFSMICDLFLQNYPKVFCRAFEHSEQ